MPLPNLSNRASNSRTTSSLNGQELSANTYREQVREKILNSPRRNMDNKSMSNGDFRRSIDLNFTSENILFHNDQPNRNSLKDFRPKTPRRQDSAFRGNRQVIVYNKTYVPSAADGFINNDDNQNDESFSQESSNLKTNTPVNFKSQQTNSLSQRHRKKSFSNQIDNTNLNNSMLSTLSRNDSINNEESRPNSIETNPDLIDNDASLRRCKSSYASRSRQSFYPNKINNDEFDLIDSSVEYNNSNFKNNSKNGDNSNTNQKENNNSTNYFMNNNRRSRHSNLIDNGNSLSNSLNTRRSLNIEKNSSDILFKNDYIDDSTNNHSTKSSHDFRSTSRASFRDDNNNSSSSNSYYPVPTPRKTTGQTSNNNQSNNTKTNLFANNSNIYQDSNNMTDFRIKRNSHSSLNKILTPKVPYTPTPRKSLSNKQQNQLDTENSHLFNQSSNEENFIGNSIRKASARGNRSTSRDSNNFNTSYSNSNINFNNFDANNDNDDANDDADYEINRSDDYLSYSSGNNAGKGFNENHRQNKPNNTNFNYSQNKRNYKNFN